MDMSFICTELILLLRFAHLHKELTLQRSLTVNRCQGYTLTHEYKVQIPLPQFFPPFVIQVLAASVTFLSC